MKFKEQSFILFTYTNYRTIQGSHRLEPLDFKGKDTFHHFLVQLTCRTYTYMKKLKKRDNKYRKRLFIAYFLTICIFNVDIVDIGEVKISGLSFKESVDCSVAIMIITSVLMIFLIRFKESKKLSYDDNIHYSYREKIIA